MMETGQSKKRNKSKKNQDTPNMPQEPGRGRFGMSKAGVTKAHRVSGKEAFGTQAKGSYAAHGAELSPSTRSRVKEQPRAADTKGITKIGKY